MPQSELYVLCDQCGTENPNRNKYCGECGAKLDPGAKVPEPVHAPVGPVSSAFRREVEQQQLRLQRLDEEPIRNYSEMATSSVENAPDAEAIVDAPLTPSEQPTGPRNPEETGYATNTEEPAYVAKETAYPSKNEDTISGPSFLGLSGSEPNAQQDLSYLYEDDATPGRARKLLALVIALGFIAFIAYEWKQNPNWQTAIIGKLTKANPTASTTTPPQATNAQQEPVSGNAAAPPPNPQPQPQVAASQTPTGPEQAPGSSQQPSSSSGLSASSQPAGTGSGSPKNTDTTVAQGVSSAPGITPSGTNSTGATGEQAAVDIENAGAANPAKSAPEHLAAQKTGSARTSAIPTSAKTEQPDDALVKKADAYLYGRGVPTDCQQALVYLRTAANRGNAAARSRLGGLYATGHCVPLDRAEAYNWFTLSRDAGANNVWVQRNREILWSKMTADEKARAMEPPR